MTETFDYIVVGAGTAGCIVAHHLSADRRNRVLLIEAGKPNNGLMVRIPAAYPALQRTERDWQFYSAPQRNLLNRKLYLPRGRMVGGTGAMNGMIYYRGFASDYAQWGAGWNWENEVLPAFLELESYQSQGIEDERPQYGKGGFWLLTPATEVNVLNAQFLDAALQCGLPAVTDLNWKAGEAVAGYHVGTTRRGERWHTARAFLEPALKRSNLTLWTETLADTLQLSGDAVTGITVLRKGQKQTVTARQGVVLTAGSFLTPALLQRSGIGPADVLQAAGVEVQQEVGGVGAALQDHQQYFLGAWAHRVGSLNTVAKSPWVILDWFLRRRGTLAGLISPAGAFFHSGAHADPTPDLQIHFVPGIAGDDIHDLKRQPKVDGYMVGLTLLRPKSRGTVQITSADAQTPPAIDLNFLDHPDDLASLLAGWDMGEQLVEAEAFDRVRKAWAKPSDELPEPHQREQFIRQTLESVYHSSSTCRMGPDADAPLTPQLNLKAVPNLWVADASAFPTLPSGNIQAVIGMVAHRAAAFMLQS